MAKESGFIDADWNYTIIVPYLEAFAAQVREDEREACAKVCEDSVEYAGDELARQIRARGQDEFPYGIPFVTQEELERLRKEHE
jgi:hypothetical protein